LTDGLRSSSCGPLLRAAEVSSWHGNTLLSIAILVAM
jgi:hypothetical protein